MFLIGPNGEKFGPTERDQAIYYATDRELDLVEVGPDSQPPVCKVFDYKKHEYEREKQARKQRGKQRSGDVKEIKLGYKTDEHDLAVKAKRAEGFLGRGSRVKVFMILRGRERMFGDQAIQRMKEFRDRLNAQFDQHPNKLGNRITAILKRT